MSEKKILISTSQAASLLQVHESSVKRWCNAGTLHCEYTAGGHRRIPLGSLLDFADAQHMDCALARFGESATSLWESVDKARSRGDFDGLGTLTYQWLRQGRRNDLSRLMQFLRGWDFDLAVIFDHVIGAALRQVGNDWAGGRVSTGEEHRMTQLTNDLLHELRLAQRADAYTTRPVALVGCSNGETHEVGAIMVRLVLEAAGWDAVYLGPNVPTEDYAHLQVKHDARLVAISLMPPRGEPDARNLMRLLARMYDPAHPYRLAMGGASLHNRTISEPQSSPYAEVRFFNDVQGFATWAGGLSAVKPYAANGRKG